MSDLIWVGNTLLPRWIVFASPVAVVVVIYLFAYLFTSNNRADK